MKDLHHNVLVTQVKNPATTTAATSSPAIDLQGYASANVVFAIGASGDTLSGSVYWTLKIQHSDDDSTYTDVTAAELLSGSATVVVDSSSKDKQAYSFGYNGAKRYLKGVMTPTGTHTNGTPIGVLALRSHASLQPVN